MNKTLIFMITFLILINLVSAYEVKSLNKIQDGWVIEKQDSFEKYVDYNFEYVNTTTFILHWKVNNRFVFDSLQDCVVSDDETCMENIAAENKEQIPDYEEKTDKILGFIDNPYTISNYVDTYFQTETKAELKTKIEALQIAESAPKEVLKGKIDIKGDVQPLYLDNGELIITLPDGVSQSDGYSLKIGYSSLIATFNNSLLTETLSLGLANGFYNNVTRYLAIPRYSNVSSANMSITGYSTYNGIYEEYGNFNTGSLSPQIDYTLIGNYETAPVTYNHAYLILNSGSIQLENVVDQYKVWDSKQYLIINSNNFKKN